MVEAKVHHPWRVFWLAMGAFGLGACVNMFIKLAAQSHNVVEIMFFRNFIGMVPVVMLIQAHPLGFKLLKTKRVGAHAARSIVGTGSMALYFYSFILLPLADATAVLFAMPLVLTALSVPLLKEHVGPWRWSAVAVGFIGVLIIAAPGGTTNLLGNFVALAGATTSAFTTIMVRRLGSTEHALTVVFYFSLVGTVICAALLPWFWSPPSLSSFFYMAMTGILGGASQVLLTKAYAEAPAAYVAPFTYVSIIFAAFFGWAIWSDVPETHVIIGAGIVIISGLFILYRETVVKRHLVQDGVADMIEGQAPTEADEYDLPRPTPEARKTEVIDLPSGQEGGGVTYKSSEN